MQFPELFKMKFDFEMIRNILLNIKYYLKIFCLFSVKQTSITRVKIYLQDHHSKPSTTV